MGKNRYVVQNWQISKIKPYDRNPRDNKSAVERVAKSISEYGPRQPIVVDGEGVIIIGHTRLLAAKRLGMDNFPVHVADDLTPQHARALRIADNRTGEIATWDDSLLVEELREIEILPVDIEITGFTHKEVASIFKKQLPPDGGGIDVIKEVYGVYAVCNDEQEQVSLIERLTTEGYKCRALIS